MDMNGGVCEVVTGVTIGKSISVGGDHLTTQAIFSISRSDVPWIRYKVSIFCQEFHDLSVTRLARRSIDERSLVYFSDNPRHLLEAYAESGEGIDRAGGFAVQV